MDGSEDEKLWEEEEEDYIEKVQEQFEDVNDPYYDQFRSKEWSIPFEGPQCE